MSATIPPRIDAPHPMPRTAGHTGNVWSQDFDPKAAAEARGGYGVLDRDDRPGAYPRDIRDTTGDDMTWRDAQYGASPLRSARYDEDHRHDAAQTTSEDKNTGRPGFDNEQSRSQLPGQGKDERGNYGKGPADDSRPENYGENTANNGNRL